MLDHLRIKDRITEIRRRLTQIKESIVEKDEKEFLTESIISSATERRLQVAIQACMDIASHIVAQMTLEKPQRENKEVFTILANKGIIEKELGKRLVAMGGMRNILVHEYLDVDLKKIYHAIKHDLGDIETFIAQIQRFMDREKK